MNSLRTLPLRGKFSHRSQQWLFFINMSLLMIHGFPVTIQVGSFHQRILWDWGPNEQCVRDLGLLCPNASSLMRIFLNVFTSVPSLYLGSRIDWVFLKAGLPSVSSSNELVLFVLYMQGATITAHTRVTTEAGLTTPSGHWEVTGTPHPWFSLECKWGVSRSA